MHKKHIKWGKGQNGSQFTQNFSLDLPWGFGGGMCAGGMVHLGHLILETRVGLLVVSILTIVLFEIILT